MIITSDSGGEILLIGGGGGGGTALSGSALLSGRGLGWLGIGLRKGSLERVVGE